MLYFVTGSTSDFNVCALLLNQVPWNAGFGVLHALAKRRNINKSRQINSLSPPWLNLQNVQRDGTYFISYTFVVGWNSMPACIWVRLKSWFRSLLLMPSYTLLRSQVVFTPCTWDQMINKASCMWWSERYSTFVHIIALLCMRDKVQRNELKTDILAVSHIRCPRAAPEKQRFSWNNNRLV